MYANEWVYDFFPIRSALIKLHLLHIRYWARENSASILIIINLNLGLLTMQKNENQIKSQIRGGDSPMYEWNIKYAICMWKRYSCCLYLFFFFTLNIFCFRIQSVCAKTVIYFFVVCFRFCFCFQLNRFAQNCTLSCTWFCYLYSLSLVLLLVLLAEWVRFNNQRNKTKQFLFTERVDV